MLEQIKFIHKKKTLCIIKRYLVVVQIPSLQSFLPTSNQLKHLDLLDQMHQSRDIHISVQIFGTYDKSYAMKGFPRKNDKLWSELFLYLQSICVTYTWIQSNSVRDNSIKMKFNILPEPRPSNIFQHYVSSRVTTRPLNIYKLSSYNFYGSLKDVGKLSNKRKLQVLYYHNKENKASVIFSQSL